MNIRVHRYDHVQLCVPLGGVEVARKFYLGVLAFREVPTPANWTGFRGFWCVSGDVQLHIGIDEELKRTKGHPALVIDDVPGVRKYLEGLGVRTQDEPLIAGRRRFSFLDPFDNRIEFLEWV